MVLHKGVRVPIHVLELLVKQSKGCLDFSHGLISSCTEVSVENRLHKETLCYQ